MSHELDTIVMLGYHHGMTIYDALLHDLRELRANQSGANTGIASAAAEYINGVIDNPTSPLSGIDRETISRVMVVATGLLLIIEDDLEFEINESSCEDYEETASMVLSGFEMATDALVGAACAAAAYVEEFSAEDLSPGMFNQ